MPPVLPLLLAASAATALAASPAAEWESTVQPWLVNYCYDCHGDGLDEGGLTFDDYEDIASMVADRPRWKRIRDHIRHRLMPPPDEFQPPVEDRAKIVAWIDSAIFPVDPENPDPGRVTLRRLNRVEYENTIRDLLGVEIDVQDLLPPDDSGYGFDNIGDVLTLSPTHLDRFLDAARLALDAALHPGPMPFPTRSVQGRQIAGPGERSGRGHTLNTRGEVVFEPHVKSPGRYRVTVRAGASRAGDELAELALRVDGEHAHTWEVQAPMAQPTAHHHEIDLAAPGKRRLTIAFTNDFWDPEAADPSRRDRNVRIHSIHLAGPLDGPRLPKPASHRRIFGKRPPGASAEAWAADIFRRFSSRAFRRPPREGEAERYLHFIRLARADGRSFEEGIRHGLEAMLASPAFLFREEPQPQPDAAGQVHRIDEFTLASRLSYFLWSSMPDDRLLQLAARGQLRARLDREIERMLDSPKAAELVDNFAGQWLQLRDVRNARPSRKRFPDFDRRLRRDMATETERFVAHLIAADRPLTELLDADYTFLNARLARHYGIPGVQGDHFRKVRLGDHPRRGLLGQGSFQLVTSHPLRTSPVLRGKYVLENLLDTPPPPPPPNVPQLKPPGRHGQDLSLRQQMEKHRDDPACSSCHALMDPIGFGLENFDADGSYRTQEAGRPIDASGQLASGRRFDGPDELRAILLRDHRDDFLRSVASRLLTYALGRGTEWYDKPAIDAIVSATATQENRTRAMIQAVIHSVPFQYRRGDD